MLFRSITHATERKTSLWSLLENADFPGDMRNAARKLLTDYHALLRDLQRQATTLLERPADLTSLILHRVGYDEMLRNDTSTESETRKENLQELIGSMEAYALESENPSLQDYLERVTLAEETAARGEKASDRASLMTVHSAKGLEFDTVFVTGLEDEMFPYKGVGFGANREELDEERRLAYVAITRARKQLVLSHATFRQIFGTTRCNPPSRFLREIPEKLLSARIPGGPRLSPPTSGLPAGGFDAPAARPRSVERDGGMRVEYDDDVPSTNTENVGRGFRPGMRVKHATWGVGRIEMVEPGPELKLTVYFPGLGKSKKLLAEFIRPV